MPAPKPVLESLFDWLDQKLGEADCDDTLRLTLEFAQSHALDEKRLRDWTEKYGGYCDCEVLGNLGYERFRENIQTRAEEATANDSISYVLG